MFLIVVVKCVMMMCTLCVIRYYFLYNKQSFQLYEYLEPEKDMWTLYCQSQGEISLPPFLEVGRERGDTETDGHLSSYMISKKSADDLANLSLK